MHKALPRATIIHLTRDPMDTCYAVFKTLFVDAYHFAYQLDELAEYYIGYQRMMNHWHAVMPGVIVDVNYEELVSDRETQCRGCSSAGASSGRTRSFIPPFGPGFDHCECRPGPATVVRSSVQKWRNYACQLQPVLRRLADAGLVDGDGNPLR